MRCRGEVDRTVTAVPPVPDRRQRTWNRLLAAVEGGGPGRTLDTSGLPGQRLSGGDVSVRRPLGDDRADVAR